MRTNCMDCLDRTNVVQSVFSRNLLHTQLKSLGLTAGADLSSNPFAEFPPALEKIFRNSWSDNADVMSYLYTGTPALKTDFTRTGKRTYRGAMDDGINSVTRYYINNFTDGAYVDCLDFLTQRITVDMELRKRRKFFTPIKMQMMLASVFFLVVRFMLYSVLYKDVDLAEASWNTYLFEKLVFFGSIGICLYSIIGQGRKFIDDSTRFQ